MDAGRDERPHLLEPVVELAGADPRGQLGVARAAERARAARRAPRRAPARARPPARGSRSALAATRAWNDSRPSVPLRTSPSTHSRTASSSSATVGRSCTRRRRRGVGRGAPLERRPGEQAEQVPLVLAHPPADRGQLHRAGRPAEVAPRLHDADHAPLERAEHLPPAQRLEVDGRAAGRLVGRRQLLPGGHAAGGQRRAEAPRPHAEPAEVLHRVAEVGELPVEDRPQPVGSDEEVARAGGRRGPRAARSAPAGSPPASGSPSSKAGCGSPSPSSTSRYCADLVRRAEPVDRIGGDAVDRRHRRADLRAEPLAGRRPTRRRAGACGRSSRPRAARPPCPALPEHGAVVGRPPRRRPARRAAAAARSSAASVAMPDPAALAVRPGRSRCRISGRRAAPSTRSNDHVSRDAPPDSRTQPLDRRAAGRREQRPARATRRAASVATSGHRRRAAGRGAARRRRGASRRPRRAGYGLTAAPPPGWISKWRWGVPRALPVSPT